MDIHLPKTEQPRILILGGGFAGLELAKKLVKLDVQVVLVDRQNYHTFQPLLYQVATGALEPDSIAYPYRRIFEKKKNFFFRVSEVQEILPDKKQVELSIGTVNYDYLVIATGSKSNYYNLQKDSDLFMPLKTVPQALNLRSVFLQNFENAILTEDPEEKEALMNIVIVGAGPTGVELAGALGEMKKYVFPQDYPELDLSMMEIHVFEMTGRVLPTMSEYASNHAEKYLKKLGVNLWLNTAVDGYDGKHVIFKSEKIPADTFIWTAGVQGNIPDGVDKDVISKGNRLEVDDFNKIKGYNDIFAIGDIAKMSTEAFPDGHPMVATVAIQQGQQLGSNFKNILNGKKLKPFRYTEKGYLATVGRNKAVADLPKLKLSGFTAWFLWIIVHIMQLVGFRNKLLVFIGWMWNYISFDRALLLIIRPYKKPKKEFSSYTGKES